MRHDEKDRRQPLLNGCRFAFGNHRRARMRAASPGCDVCQADGLSTAETDSPVNGGTLRAGRFEAEDSPSGTRVQIPGPVRFHFTTLFGFIMLELRGRQGVLTHLPGSTRNPGVIPSQSGFLPRMYFHLAQAVREPDRSQPAIFGTVVPGGIHFECYRAWVPSEGRDWGCRPTGNRPPWATGGDTPWVNAPRSF